MLIAVLLVVWWLVGAAGMLWWWRTGSRETGPQDVTVADAFFCLMWGVFGPLSWLVGWLVFRPPQLFSRVVIRKRGR